MKAFDRFDDWTERHKVGVERALFWTFTTGYHVSTALAGLAAVSRLWLPLVQTAALAALATAAAWSSAEDLRYEKQRRGYPEYPAWVRRVRSCVHVALWGWSA